jgi:hypothetical protein
VYGTSPSGTAAYFFARHFRALNADFRYQLTAIGGPAPSLHVAREISRASFVIAGGAPGGTVCWQVTGVRQDAYAKARPPRIERTKRRKDRGRYLNPEAFGQPRSAGIHAVPKLPRPLRAPKRAEAPELPRLPMAARRQMQRASF